MFLKTYNKGYRTVGLCLDIDWDNNYIYLEVKRYPGYPSSEVFLPTQLNKAVEKFDSWVEEIQSDGKEYKVAEILEEEWG